MSAARIIQAIRAILFAGLAATTAAHAATTPAPAPSVTDTCLMCHADKDAKGAAGKSIAVDGAKFAASVHGEMKLKCTDCHADVSVDKLPHPDKLKHVDCGTCHDKAVKEYAGTVHGTARKGGNNVAANCTDCHGTHDILRSKDAASRTNHANIEVDVLEVPRQRRHGRDGQDAGRQHRQQVSRQHPRQGVEGRCARLGADLQQLPRLAQHPSEGRREEPHQSRDGSADLRHLPQASARRNT